MRRRWHARQLADGLKLKIGDLEGGCPFVPEGIHLFGAPMEKLGLGNIPRRVRILSMPVCWHSSIGGKHQKAQNKTSRVLSAGANLIPSSPEPESLLGLAQTRGKSWAKPHLRFR
jgi:hypothetical protein